MRIRTVLVAVAIALVVAACGGDDDTSESERPGIEDEVTATETPIDTIEPTPTAVVEEVAPSQLTYEVASGDTLGSIADDFGVPLGALIDINQFENPDFIGIGDEVVIPTEDEIAAWEAAQASAAEEPAAEEPAAEEPAAEESTDTADG